ncbi:uroporphyrinogen-III synthase [Brevundimonas sp.]|uniref:uroporphyrinogen-III synthase n=1 Tax=Brevundimonas sp. TaxID=1871086 RepID=UPI003D0E8EA3
MSELRRVWVTRARPGADRTAERLSALGFTPVVTPLLDIRPLDARPDLTGVQALAFTSRNAVKVFAEGARLPSVPVFVVGDATAASAREAGFHDVRSAGGDLHALAALIRAEAAGLSILHPCAAEPAGDLGDLVGDAARITALAVYEAIETVATVPDVWDAVLIHSPRAGRALAAGLSTEAAGRRIAVAISPAAAAPLTVPGFGEIRIAAAPTEDALLAALGKPGVNV